MSPRAFKKNVKSVSRFLNADSAIMTLEMELKERERECEKLKKKLSQVVQTQPPKIEEPEVAKIERSGAQSKICTEKADRTRTRAVLQPVNRSSNIIIWRPGNLSGTFEGPKRKKIEEENKSNRRQKITDDTEEINKKLRKKVLQLELKIAALEGEKSTRSCQNLIERRMDHSRCQRDLNQKEKELEKAGQDVLRLKRELKSFYSLVNSYAKQIKEMEDEVRVFEIEANKSRELEAENSQLTCQLLEVTKKLERFEEYEEEFGLAELKKLEEPESKKQSEEVAKLFEKYWKFLNNDYEDEIYSNLKTLSKSHPTAPIRAAIKQFNSFDHFKVKESMRDVLQKIVDNPGITLEELGEEIEPYPSKSFKSQYLKWVQVFLD